MRWMCGLAMAISDLLKADKDVAVYLTDAELEDLFDLAQHFKHVDTIFDRVFT